MGEEGDLSDTDSDETVIEGSVVESHLEDEELHGERLSLVSKDMASVIENNLATGLKITNGEKPSPEIQPFCKRCIDLHIERQRESINLLYQEAIEKEESQSLIQVGISCPVIATVIYQPVCPQATTTHGENSQTTCISFDSEETGFQGTSARIQDEVFPELSLLSSVDAIEESKDSVTKCTEVSETVQSARMSSNKEDITENCLSLDTEASIITTMAEKFDVTDLMEPLSDFKNPEISPLLDMLEYQDDCFSVDAPMHESCALPVELLTVLNSLSESVAPSVFQPAEKGSRHSMAEKQLTPEQMDDDCTQITDTHIEPQYLLQHREETEPLMVTRLPCLSLEQHDFDQHMHKLALSDNQTVSSYNIPTGEGNSMLKETSSCEQIFQVTSYTLRTSALKRTQLPCSDVEANSLNPSSNDQRCLKEALQKINSYEAQARQLGSQETHTNDMTDQRSCHSSILHADTKVEQVRKSQRIAKKRKNLITFKNCSSDDSFSYISLGSVNSRDIFGQTLLHIAAMEDDLGCVRAMIKSGANVNAQDDAGWTPLHKASMAGFYEITNELLKAGAAVNCQGSEKVTPLQDAVKEGQYKVAELLLWYGADPLLQNEKGKSALEEATDKRMRKLLESYVASSSRKSASAERLIEDLVTDQSRVDQSQSQLKVKTNSVDQVQLSLIDNTKSLRQLIIITSANSVQMQQTDGALQIEIAGSQANGKGNSIYSEASGKENSSVSQTEEQHIPNALDSSHSHEKEKTASSSQQQCTRTARINKRNTKGKTRLHLAAKKGDLSLVKSLIAAGACVNQKDNAGWTAIHEASNKGCTEVIAELLKAGADVNSKSMDGVLPIRDAVSGNHFEAVQLLLSHGANPNEADECGKNALDEATCDKMKELLKSYGADENKETSGMSDDAGGRHLCCSRSRRICNCYDCSGKNNWVSYSHASKQKCGTHESISKILQDIEKAQDKLLLFELRSQRDADLYIQDLSQIQNILNDVLAKQKSERDVLAKKYRASQESFKQGAPREQIVKLVSRQKSLLLMAQKQKELGRKIQNYNNAKKGSSSSAKQLQTTVSSCENNAEDVTFNKTAPDVTGLETTCGMENSFLNQKISQYPHRSLNMLGSNEDAIRQKEVGIHTLVSENRFEDHVPHFKSSDAIDQATWPSEPIVCFAQTKQAEETDYILVAPQEKKLPNATPRICALNISAAGSFDASINQLTTEGQHICTNQSLEQHSNINEAFQMQPGLPLESTHSYLATDQKNISPNNRISFNANLVPTRIFSHALSPSRISQNSSQFSNNQDHEKQLNFKGSRRKKNQLVDLLELGKIKPGDDVLEFMLQDSKHKASLLQNGKIRTAGNNSVYPSLLQWIKALLGDDISVSWKYVLNKVTYCGTLLSKIIAELHIPKEPEIPLQQKRLVGRNSAEWDHRCDSQCYCSTHSAMSLQDVNNMQQRAVPFLQEEMENLPSPDTEAEETLSMVREKKTSYQPNSSESLRRFLQFNEILLIEDEEFLPCHLMEQYWNFYAHCENFGFKTDS